MSRFKFNGVSSDELGLIITETPFRPTWSEKSESITIPGRSTQLRQSSGTYENQDLTIETVISDTSKIKDIYEVLQGTGTLELSTHEGEYINVDVYPLVPQGVALTMAKLPVTFTCSPFAYSIEPTVVDMGTSYTPIPNPGTVYSEPLITFKVKADEAPVLKGDVNFDGVVDARDVSLVMSEYANIQAGGEPTFTPEQLAAADVNGDGVLDARDASEIMKIYADSQTGGSSENTPEKQCQIDVNGEVMMIGLPSAAVRCGYTVTLDCSDKLLYYTNSDGEKVNILQYSYGDFPLLHTGTNYAKYSGDISDVKITVNERWR